MSARKPIVDFSLEPQWRWPAWKFKLQCEDLFTKLHHQYNTYEAPLQDFEAFHHDVWEISNSVTTADELYRKLKERKEQRIEEMTQSFDEMAALLTAGSSMLSGAAWGCGVEYFRTRSLDSLLRFLFSFLDDKDKESIRESVRGLVGAAESTYKAIQTPDASPSEARANDETYVPQTQPSDQPELKRERVSRSACFSVLSTNSEAQNTGAPFIPSRSNQVSYNATASNISSTAFKPSARPHSRVTKRTRSGKLERSVNRGVNSLRSGSTRYNLRPGNSRRVVDSGG